MKLAALSFYEYAGIILPGATLIIGVMWIAPNFTPPFLETDVSLGDFGLFVLAAYVAGQLLQGVGNILERVWWALWSGMPSMWVLKANQTLISKRQSDVLAARLSKHKLIAHSSLREVPRDQWRPISRQIYASVMSAGQMGRVDTFNGMYGLNRGLAVAFALLILMHLASDPEFYGVTILLILAMVSATYRMHLFGIHYARELFVQYLELPGKEPRDAD